MPLFAISSCSGPQLLIMTIWETAFYSINFALVYHYFFANDVGGSMVIHIFGAFFGLSCSYFSAPSDIAARSEDNVSTATSDIFSMIGSLYMISQFQFFFVRCPDCQNLDKSILFLLEFQLQALFFFTFTGRRSMPFSPVRAIRRCACHTVNNHSTINSSHYCESFIFPDK